jgi:hypothetical protein
MIDYPKEALQALAEYLAAFDKCANEPDESYGTAFIEMEPLRERLKQFFTPREFDAIIINTREIHKILRDAGLMPK